MSDGTSRSGRVKCSARIGGDNACCQVTVRATEVLLTLVASLILASCAISSFSRQPVPKGDDGVLAFGGHRRDVAG
jgi:hypothetical protein